MESPQSLLRLRKTNLYELIFKHLSVSDLLNFSEVSHNFYDLVAKSPISMQKIQLVIRENWQREFSFSDVEHSKRPYTHIKVEDLLRTRDEVAKMLKKFAGSVTTIQTRFDIDTDEVLLPNLSSLSINARLQSSYVENSLMLATKSLKKLTLHSTPLYPDIVIKSLENNSELEELTLEYLAQNTIIPLLTEDLGECLQLKKLLLDSFPSNLADSYREQFEAFMRTQTDYLEDFKIFHIDYSFMERNYHLFTNLKRLTYSASDKVQFDSKQPMKFNMNVEELNLIEVNECIVRTFLEKSPNAKKLYVALPSLKTFKDVALFSPRLSEFRFAAFEDKTVEEAKEKLAKIAKKYEPGIININMKISQI